jgi:hypothetical protein
MNMASDAFLKTIEDLKISLEASLDRVFDAIPDPDEIDRQKVINSKKLLQELVDQRNIITLKALEKRYSVIFAIANNEALSSEEKMEELVDMTNEMIFGSEPSPIRMINTDHCKQVIADDLHDIMQIIEIACANDPGVLSVLANEVASLKSRLPKIVAGLSPVKSTNGVIL